MTDYNFGLSEGGLGSYADGVPRIRLGSWFYSFGGINDGSWQCVGARLYCPAGAAGLGTIRIYVNHWTSGFAPNAAAFSFDPALVARSKDVEAPGSAGWVEVVWDTPFTFADSPASLLFIWYEFIDSPGQYEYDSSKVNTPIESTALPGMFLANYNSDAESRSYFTQSGTDAVAATLPAPGARNVWYGSEPIVRVGDAEAVPEGAVSTDHDWSLVVVGELVPNQGTATVDHDWTITVTGEAVPNEGDVAAAHDWAVAVVGETPTLPVPEGATAPSYSWDVLVYVAPQAQSLLMPSDAELAQARALQEMIMSDVGEIRKPSTRVFNDVTRKYDVVPGDLVYEGRMLVQVRDIKASNVLVAEDREPSSDYAVKVPWNVAGASEGQVVWVTSSRDPDLINFYFTIKSVERSSWATCRRMIATLSGERS